MRTQHHPFSEVSACDEQLSQHGVCLELAGSLTRGDKFYISDVAVLRLGGPVCVGGPVWVWNMEFFTFRLVTSDLTHSQFLANELVPVSHMFSSPGVA